MTDTTARIPTDAEIVSLAYDCNALPETITDAALLVFARAVLAKWGGSEAQAAAPIKTLEEAIAHAKEVAKGDSTCAMEHAKLAAWLTDLQLLRANLAARGAAQAAPVGMEPVARIEGIDEYGPRLEWTQHWVDVGVGAKLFTAAQVQAMLAAVPRNAALYNPDDVAFPVQRSADGVDALPPELASTAAAKKGGQHAD